MDCAYPEISVLHSLSGLEPIFLFFHVTSPLVEMTRLTPSSGGLRIHVHTFWRLIRSLRMPHAHICSGNEGLYAFIAM